MAAGDWFRLNDSGAAELARGIDDRVRERLRSGVLTAEETAFVAERPLRLLRVEGRLAADALRRCCITWEIDREEPLRSHRRFVGPPIVFLKRIVRRLLRFQIERPLALQREFNRNLLIVVGELVRERDRDG